MVPWFNNCVEDSVAVTIPLPFLARARAWRERRQQRPACSRRRGGGAALACPQRFLAHHVSRLARTISLVYTG